MPTGAEAIDLFYQTFVPVDGMIVNDDTGEEKVVDANYVNSLELVTSWSLHRAIKNQSMVLDQPIMYSVL